MLIVRKITVTNISISKEAEEKLMNYAQKNLIINLWCYSTFILLAMYASLGVKEL